MQKTLTLKHSQISFFKKKKTFPLRFFAWCLVTISVLFIIIFMVSVYNHRNSYNKNEKYFLLSLNHANSLSVIKTRQDAANQIVGESYIHQINGLYHVVGFVYENNLDAENYLKSSKSFFVNAQVFSVTEKKLENKIITKINQNLLVKNAYKFHVKIREKLLSLCTNAINYENVALIYKEIYKIEQKQTQNISLLKNLDENKVINQIIYSCDYVLSVLNVCKSEIITGGDLVNNLKLAYLKCFFEINSLKNLLNNL